LADDIVWEPGFEAQFLLNNKSSNILALAAATLDAQVAWARGEKEQAIQAWRQPVKLESKIQYDEPPAWFYPVRQSLAATLLRSGRSEGGIRLSRGDQKATARRPAALRPVAELDGAEARQRSRAR